MTPANICPEHQALSQKVIEAIQRVYALRDQLDTAKKAKSMPDVIEGIQQALKAAREAELHAETALREHVEGHGCTPNLEQHVVSRQAASAVAGRR